MKQIGSVITGLAKPSAEQTGVPAGATGSATLPGSPRAPVLYPALKASVEPMLSALTKRWLATEYYKTTDQLIGHGSSLLQEVISTLDNDLATIEEAMRPAGKAEIIKTIEAMAALFQAPVPDGVGLDLYIMALARMPAPVFRAARNELVTTHKWPRLPLPADFVEAGKHEQSVMNTAQLTLRNARRNAERALLALR